MKRLILGMVLAAGAVGADGFNDAPPNAAGQVPAFAGQTRAPVVDAQIGLRRQVVARGLRSPWGMDLLPDGRWIVTEKRGRMVLIDAEGARAIGGLPPVADSGQGGLLDVVVDPEFAGSRRLWWSYAEPSRAGAATAVATGVLSADETQVQQVRVLFRQQPAVRGGVHFGSRLVLDGRGGLFVTTGDRGQAALAQDPRTGMGKVVRIDLASGQVTLWSRGHRNLQAAALSPAGALWTVEHGPRGGDELNRPARGRNYGWPVISYGENYNGRPVGAGLTQAEGMEQPVYYWDPVIAPSGMAFYQGDLFEGWRGSVLIGGLAGRALVRLTLADGRVTGEARYLQGWARIRDVAVAPDGAVMVLTDGERGALWRLTPEG